jgi:hypothetical protein
MTQEPQREVEVQGRAGEPVALPVGNDGPTSYTWTLELPDGVEAAGTTGGRLLVRADEPGSHVLVATLADPGSPTPMTVLSIRVTVV